MLTNRQKTIRAIPGITVGFFMIGIIIWGVSGDKKCRKLLERDSCVQQVAFCKYSKETFRGSGNEVSTGFISPVDTLQYFVTDAFIRPLPEGLPIMVKYSLEAETCYKFLWDSTLVFKGYRVRFFHIKNQGMDYELTKIEK